MVKKDLVAFLKANGWEEDRWGHFQKTVKSGKKLRVKIQDLSVRLEVQVRHEATGYTPAKNEWVRFGGAYYTQVHQTATGDVQIGGHVLRQSRETT